MDERSVLGRTLSAFERLPGWLQPAVAGALILFLLVSVRVVFALPRIVAGEVGPLHRLPIMFVAAMGAGAAGGFGYSFVGKPLLRVPVVGRYLTGIVCIAAYLTPLLLWSDRVFGGEKVLSFSKTSDVVVWAFCVLLFGIVMGHTWFDSPRSPKSTPSLTSHTHRDRDKDQYPWYLRGDSSIDTLQRRQYDRMAASLRRTRRLLRIVAAAWAVGILGAMAIGRRVTPSGVLFLVFALLVFASSYWPIRDFDRDRAA